jgi:serine/threonine protein kinase
VSLDFEVIGPYRVIRVLGQGGMGTVYEAVHAKSKDPVAVKVIAANLAQHQRFRRRFDAEIQTLIKLKHPNIVQLIGFGEEKGLLFYSMEYVDGENLQQELRRSKTLPWERVVDLAIDVCSALKHAHDFGVIHRDLKPANLMINSQGKLKLTDFGIARLFGASEVTVEGSVLGTADYMSPEQAEGKTVSLRSDLYSLGCICYTALTGRPPFMGKNIPEILFNVRYGTLTPLSTLAPQVPKELCGLIEEMLRKEPSMRPPTGLVVGNRLQSLRAGLTKRAKDLAADKTEVGNLKELTSIDLRDDTELASALPSMTPSDATVVLSDKNKTRPSESFKKQPDSKSDGDHSEEQAKTKSATSPSISHSVAGPQDLTRIALSNSEFELSDPPSGLDLTAKTNFTEVGESDRRRSSIVIADTESATAWNQWLSVAGLIGVLVLCAGIIFWFTRPPSADSLYLEISQAMNSAEDSQILDAEPIAESFQTLYPSDPRNAEVAVLLEEIESLQTIKQLQRKARRGGTDLLDPVEQAFLECVKYQEIDSEIAKRKLRAMATVFRGSENLTAKQRIFVDQASRLAEHLEAESKPSRNPAIESINEQMIWAEANLPASTRAEWLRGLIELFEEKPWARELIESAKRKLEAIE